jgi:HEAT repeat protein
VRIIAAYSAARLGNGSRVAEIGWALMTGKGPEREMAARLLARLPSMRAAKMLVAGLGAPQPGVRALSARGLARARLALPEAVKGLAELARDRHGGVRSSAAAALGTIATPQSLAALEGFMGDPSVEVRLAACSALIGAKRTEGVPAAVRGLGDTDPRVQCAAALAMTAMTGKDFGLRPGRVPTAAELRAAVLRAQLWYGEHMGEFRREE